MTAQNCLQNAVGFDCMNLCDKCNYLHTKNLPVRGAPFSKFAKNTPILAQMVRFVSFRIENIVGSGENTGIQHFLCFPICFQKGSSSGS